jgi:hypothetical protein
MLINSKIFQIIKIFFSFTSLILFQMKLKIEKNHLNIFFNNLISLILKSKIINFQYQTFPSSFKQLFGFNKVKFPPQEL